jgi:hypothetical protein
MICNRDETTPIRFVHASANANGGARSRAEDSPRPWRE